VAKRLQKRFVFLSTKLRGTSGFQKPKSNNFVTVPASQSIAIFATFGPLVCLIIMLDRVTDPRIQRMRADIEQSGETLLDPGDLNLLREGEFSEDQQWKTIAEIAIREGWSFTFLPDDRVRFAKL
jgi:hypothetical protein